MADRYIVGFDPEFQEDDEDEACEIFGAIDLENNEFLGYSQNTNAAHRFVERLNNPHNRYHSYEAFEYLWKPIQ